ncbi:MAG: acyl-CoA thioesterase [Desulfovibrionales bacterium]|nr:acyl-CoA thioesterase [Desulfovibrionales bacterium]
MIQTMTTPKRVNFEDCDPFSHLNNANYLKYFLNAREKQLRENKILDIFGHAQKTGNGWAVIAHDIRYLRPARLGEELEIWSRMLTFDHPVNLVEFVMCNPTTGQLKSVMHSQFAYFSVKTAQPAPMDEELTHLFQKISLFSGQALGAFDLKERIPAIKGEIQARLSDKN